MADIGSVKEHFTDCVNIAKSRNNTWVFVMVDKLKDALELLNEQQKQIEEAYDKGFDDGQKNILEAQAE